MDTLALVPAAFLAGILMFLAPCTLPIVPGYLAFIAGVPEGDLKDPLRRSAARRKLFLNALAFVVGFSLIFILLGLFAGAAGSFLGAWRFVIGQAAGVVLILFGLTMLGALRVPGLSGEWHMKLPSWLSIGHPQSSFFVGALFSLGWSPCIGPILGSILFLAAGSATAYEGALLLGVFSVGLGLPFLLTALFAGEAVSYLARAGKVARGLNIAGGIILIAIGALMAFGKAGLLVAWGFTFFSGYEAILRFM